MKIVHGIADGFCRGRQDRNNPAGKYQQENGCGGSYKDKKYNGAADGIPDPFFIFRADSPSDHDSGPHCQANNHDRNHMHHLRTDRNRGDNIGAVVLPGNEKISKSIQRLQKIG